ncbi:uncharacterized protein OCT59_010253 [Rhizophagus irregularis]|uniref:MATA-HMG n=2 Tax=Rhizophagus irregularis TaxID=588596 RepID=A0A015KCT4_RHIIW|nr:hypothetical protein GLOIN_2v1768967 [Rhizophagus irregularis DAOM 181602=DAOM 197198]EXX77385.1 hypothetical protein RirG_024130 [Rhizophagus irregularis DAOM 197198w]UZO18946.1 hypothetical protein OCT59_010253 [Rhizophagus irregularis]POG76567.1 hypothetical protein GLOIN_2v1768967 [Rhizophagus irregularis DAOM 181602=DAOM 197198]CAG8503488.1 21229_t:CDS:2 [Rhizophagus irregularis]GBC30278.1 kinase-like domain-containing protein [Rhizophagus irregularis DAOM 181602=DAOM 197198]|eukprot:XP_025183433.1 hypothetical protein GLOIN_2v1768967 [Rhizophagus irregularis DAOM 181602=DAOM 197198]
MSLSKIENQYRPPFPPNITAYELLNYKSVPNPFIIYRIAVRMECKSKNITIERKNVSNIASNLWKSEPAIVKNTYKEIEIDAKILHNIMIQQENGSVTSSISSNNIFIPSPPLLQQENPFSYFTPEQQSNLTPLVLYPSDLVPEQSPCQVSNNNEACFPYLPQENPFTHGSLIIEQRVQTLEENFYAFYQILNESGYHVIETVVTGSGTNNYANIKQRIQILELQKNLFYQTLVQHGFIDIVEQGTIENFSTLETLNIEKRIQLLENQINLFFNHDYSS